MIPSVPEVTSIMNPVFGMRIANVVDTMVRYADKTYGSIKHAALLRMAIEWLVFETLNRSNEENVTADFHLVTHPERRFTSYRLYLEELQRARSLSSI